MSSVAGNGVGEHETTSRHVDAEELSMASRRERKAVMRSEIAVPRRRVHNVLVEIHIEDGHIP